jgi:DNA repair protein RecO (recombination protein O)
MPNYKVNGIVLKARHFGESDRILTILDRDLGKLEGVAKGARRAQSTLRGPCQPFSHNLFFLWHGKSLDGISQVEVVDSFAGLRDNLLKLAAASYLVELVDDVARERDPSPELFDLLLESFRWLEEAEPNASAVTHILRAFDLRFLGLAGFAPTLDACASCGSPAEAWAGGGAVAFSAAAVGIVCPACRAAVAVSDETGGGFGFGDGQGGPAGPSVVLVAAGTLAAMRHLAAAASVDQARVLRLTPRAAKEMEQALRAHLRYHLDRQLKSLDFLDTVLS